MIISSLLYVESRSSTLSTYNMAVQLSLPNNQPEYSEYSCLYSHV